MTPLTQYLDAADDEDEDDEYGSLTSEEAA